MPNTRGQSSRQRKFDRWLGNEHAPERPIRLVSSGSVSGGRPVTLVVIPDSFHGNCRIRYLWLNDATSADGAQEFAVIKRAGPLGRPWQVESITFSWCDFDTALRYIQQTLRGEDDNSDFAHEVSPILQSPSEHGCCSHCR